MLSLTLLTFVPYRIPYSHRSVNFFISKRLFFNTYLRSYLFGDVALVQGEAQEVANDAGNEGALQDNNAANPANPLNLDGDLGAAHQALVQREGPTGFQPYNRPNLFPLRVSFFE